jgi:hypothetical protein
MTGGIRSSCLSESTVPGSAARVGEREPRYSSRQPVDRTRNRSAVIAPARASAVPRRPHGRETPAHQRRPSSGPPQSRMIPCPETTMDSTAFDRLCDELGYEPSTVRVIRVTAREVSVTYTEPSGMPAGSTHPLQREVDGAA